MSACNNSGTFEDDDREIFEYDESDELYMTLSIWHFYFENSLNNVWSLRNLTLR